MPDGRNHQAGGLEIMNITTTAPRKRRTWRKRKIVAVPELLNAEQVGRAIGVKGVTVLRWALDGRVPSIRANQRVIRFRLSDVLRAMEVAGV